MKNKSCVTNLLETLDFLTKCLWDKIPIVIAFIDFLKAFDLVAHKRLVFKLSRYGINGSLLAWISAIKMYSDVFKMYSNNAIIQNV